MTARDIEQAGWRLRGFAQDIAEQARLIAISANLGGNGAPERAGLCRMLISQADKALDALDAALKPQTTETSA